MSEEHAYLKEQGIGTQFSGVYYVANVAIKKARNNNEFMDITLKDKSGSVSAKLWSVNPKIKKGIYAKAMIGVEDYQGIPSYIIRNIEEYDKTINVEFFIPSVQNMDSLKDKFNAYLAIINDLSETNKLHLEDIIASVFTDEFKKEFFNAPGDVNAYYGKIGGALEKTINVCQIAFDFTKNYSFDEVDGVYTLTASILSQVGCVDAFKMEDCAAVKTNVGTLIPVKTLSAKMIKKPASVSEVAYNKIIHAITSAENTECLPCTKEAIAVQSAILVDSRITSMFDYIERDVHVEDGFTTFDTDNKRAYFIGR